MSWDIRHEIAADLPAGPGLTVTVDGTGKGTVKRGGTLWGNITATSTTSGTPTLTIHAGKESPGSKERDFTIVKNGKTMICSLDPKHDGNVPLRGGGGDTGGGSWTATDQ